MTGRARFLSHLECVDGLLAAFRRAGFQVALSHGHAAEAGHLARAGAGRRRGVAGRARDGASSSGEHDPDERAHAARGDPAARPRGARGRAVRRHAAPGVRALPRRARRAARGGGARRRALCGGRGGARRARLAEACEDRRPEGVRARASRWWMAASRSRSRSHRKVPPGRRRWRARSQSCAGAAAPRDRGDKARTACRARQKPPSARPEKLHEEDPDLRRPVRDAGGDHRGQHRRRDVPRARHAPLAARQRVPRPGGQRPPGHGGGVHRRRPAQERLPLRRRDRAARARRPGAAQEEASSS